MDYIDGRQCYKSFLAGANRLIESRAELNELNKFPVADKDTGDNLATMMNQIIFEIESKESIGAILKDIANEALKGARGNSGIIFAEYLIGISEYTKEKENIDIKTFIRASKLGRQYAYRAVKNPVEGTMLTMMKIWEESLESIESEKTIFKNYYQAALEKAETKFMEISKSSDKELIKYDSGARGFLYFLQGILSSRDSKKLDMLKCDLKANFRLGGIYEAKKDLKSHRYCLEIYLNKKDPNSKDLKHKIKKLGNSLVYAQKDDKVRIHIHTDEPYKIVDLAESSGKIIYKKVDDFKYQVKPINPKSIAIWTDSIADIPNHIRNNKDVYILPMQIQIGNQTYLDGITLDNKIYKKKLKSRDERIISSQPNKEQIRRQLEFLVENYDGIIGLFVSSKMSGTYQSVREEVSKNYSIKHKIEIIDTKKNSGAQALLVDRAVRKLESNCSYEEIINEIKASIEKTSIFVRVKSFDSMVRSGRIPHKASAIAEKLNFFPIVTIDKNGAGKFYKASNNLEKCLDKIISQLSKDHKKHGVICYGISHFDAIEDALDLAVLLESILDQKPIFIEEISPIVASSAGRGAIAISYMKGE